MVSGSDDAGWIPMYVFTQIQIAEAASRMIKQRRGEPRNSATETEGGSVQAYMQTSSVRFTTQQ